VPSHSLCLGIGVVQQRPCLFLFHHKLLNYIMAITHLGNPVATTVSAPPILDLDYRRAKLFECIDELFMINTPDKWIEMLSDNLADLLSPDHWTGDESALTKNEIFETVFMYQRL